MQGRQLSRRLLHLGERERLIRRLSRQVGMNTPAHFHPFVLLPFISLFSLSLSLSRSLSRSLPKPGAVSALHRSQSSRRASVHACTCRGQTHAPPLTKSLRLPSIIQYVQRDP